MARISDSLSPDGLESGKCLETSTVQGFESAGKIKWTSQDHKFLKALKIATDDDSH